MSTVFARFSVHQIVYQKLFNYYGAIIDVDPEFCGSEQWYERVALSRPPEDEPWNHVLRDGTATQTYVAERNLEAYGSDQPIRHPDLDHHFDGIGDGAYVSRRPAN